MTTPIHLLDRSVDGGSIEGYVVDAAAEQIEIWFSDRHRVEDQAILSDIQLRFGNVAVINNLSVDEEMREQGIGSQLLDRAIEDAALHGASAILLLADEGESQLPGFDLRAWYAARGFEELVQTSSGPIMMLTFDA